MSTGWCHWYRQAGYPAEATAGPRQGEAGIDGAIGNPAWAGQGIGTKMIAALVAEYAAITQTPGSSPVPMPLTPIRVLGGQPLPPGGCPARCHRAKRPAHGHHLPSRSRTTRSVTAHKAAAFRDPASLANRAQFSLPTTRLGAQITQICPSPSATAGW